MIIVTGATHGIGRACVETLAAAGSSVVATGREAAAGQELANAYPNVTFVRGDVMIEADCAAVVERAAALGAGRIDGLVNNAGMSKPVAFGQTTQADWDDIMAVNARSAFFFVRHALPHLVEARGSVVNIASVAGKIGEEGLAVYCASKAAMIGMTQALALEFGDSVRFNAVCPGQIATRMMAGISTDAAKRRPLEARIPANRFGTSDEVADVVAWLLSAKASYVNGAVVTVDGGESAGLRTPRTSSADGA